MSRKPVLVVEDLSMITPSGKVLVEHAHLSIGRAEVVLLVGPSGSGKSSIVHLLSGLLGDDGAPWMVCGTMHHQGRDYDLSLERCNVGALVFQGYALFDDLTVLENLRIALDHADHPDLALAGLTASLLQDIDPRQTVASSSGGQRQRIAIARTLLANRPLLLFDEPNSGLDPFAAQRLASLIRDLCRRMDRPALIVAHHVDDLLPLADAVYLLDTHRRTLRSLPPDRQAVEAALLALGSPEAGASGVTRFGVPWRQGLSDSRPPFQWFFRYLHEYFWILLASPLMLIYIFSGAAIVGFVTMWFGFNYDLLGDVVRSFVHDESLMGLGFIEANVIMPLILSVMLVARNNAIITADLGNRVLSAQFRAMRNLRIPGRRYLTWAILINMIAGSLILVTASMAIAAWSSYLTWQILFPGQPFELWQENFFGAFYRPNQGWVRTLGWISLKVLTSSAAAAGVAIRIGLSAKDSVIAVNYAIARSIVVGVTLTLMIHAFITVLQF
ncbi:MAG: ATP-binding cassette domain-containing protein [Pseudomonadota bacterium]